MVEHLICNQTVAGSNPVLGSTRYKMNTTNEMKMLQTQVDILTLHCRELTKQVDQLQERLAYIENVVVTLLVALKDGGVIVDSDETANEQTYEF